MFIGQQIQIYVEANAYRYAKALAGYLDKTNSTIDPQLLIIQTTARRNISMHLSFNFPLGLSGCFSITLIKNIQKLMIKYLHYFNYIFQINITGCIINLFYKFLHIEQYKIQNEYISEITMIVLINNDIFQPLL